MTINPIPILCALDLFDPLRKLCDGMLTVRLRTGHSVESGARDWCSWLLAANDLIW